ncbi:MAG: hypothetical protein A3E36_02420 [Candidatus Andersenbacteria bacterium RIFCSPHIGHO2_12_FULL_45_11b]|uniref:Uncharacterized protein n=1 Tax=Candidatus Andersenbacteria bacterium RIFCSPHIGHO2_12_FULL_45_11b TaxID=1797282 RepID=A0A1G1X7V9_9BACT|nr:MAG: hypothetical protein A3E36_02420 [Candidatus Andersenbacteria bacterium RIFCSPHIGHO2_12_FULL_45_11b]
MSRKAVIGIVIILILSIIAGVAVFVIISLGKQQDAEQSSDTTSQIGLTGSDSLSVDPLADPDNDGLTNAQESLWGTNPNNPDSDADGYKDGEEVAACHNPLVPTPNDKLLNCKPGQQANISPAPSGAPQSSDPFFLTAPAPIGGSINLTQAYATAVKDSDKSPVTFSQFISNQPVTTSLPQINDAAIRKNSDSSPAALSLYMKTAGNLSSLSDKPRLTIALNDFFNNRSTYGFETLAQSVELFQSRLKLASVPNSALEYDKLLLGYTELLAATFRQITDFPNDQIKAMAGIRQLDAIDRLYFPQIAQQRDQLFATIPQQ